MKIIFTNFFIIFSFSLLFSQEISNKNDTITLITRKYKDGNTVITKHNFVDNEYIGADSIFINGAVSFSFIFNNKYIIIDGHIYNINRNEFIFKLNNKSNTEYFINIGFYQNKMYFYNSSCYDNWFITKKRHKIDTCNCYYYFDFENKIFNKIGSISDHPYLLYKKDYINTFTFLLVYYKGVVIYIGDRFKAESYVGDDNKPPFLWLTDTTFLTQSSNGVIVKADTTGNIDTIASLPRIQKRLGLANLYRDSTGIVVYEFFKSKPVFEYKFYGRYKIDIENKTYQKYIPVFTEGDFFYNLKKDKYYYYYNNKLLFKKEYSVKYDKRAKIYKNYLAYLNNNNIMVYNSKTDSWIKISNSDNASIIGWIVND